MIHLYIDTDDNRSVYEGVEDKVSLIKHITDRLDCEQLTPVNQIDVNDAIYYGNGGFTTSINDTLYDVYIYMDRILKLECTDQEFAEVIIKHIDEYGYSLVDARLMDNDIYKLEFHHNCYREELQFNHK